MDTPKNNINKDAARWAIDAVWHALGNLSCKDTLAAGFWTDLNTATQRNEKAHRSWMQGSWKKHHPHAVSVQTAARYFAAIAPFREFTPPKSWLEAAQLREDWIIGHALKEWWINQGHWQQYIACSDALKKPIEMLQAIDYGEHLVR